MHHDTNQDKTCSEKALEWVSKKWLWIALPYAILCILYALFGGILNSFIGGFFIDGLPLGAPTTFNELGDFLAGVFAPLAFLILAVALHVQKKELGHSVEQLEASAKAIDRQADIQEFQATLLERQLINDYIHQAEKSLTMKCTEVGFQNPNIIREQRNHGHYETVIKQATEAISSLIESAKKGNNNAFNQQPNMYYNTIAYADCLRHCRSMIDRLTEDYPSSYLYWHKAVIDSELGEFYGTLAGKVLQEYYEVFSPHGFDKALTDFENKLLETQGWKQHDDETTT